MKRQGIGRSQGRELRLALRGLRVARRHVAYARNLHRVDEVTGLRLMGALLTFGKLERALVELINQAQRVRRTQRRAA